ncbi:MAG TPA: GAF domain-containing protein [Chloroflexota bacterium]|nr:GAF domain-containing protein [Chloroflexota bacterium]
MVTQQDALTQRVIELETIAQISTAVSGILDLDQLLQFALVRTKEQFDLYHVNIALLDEAGENLLPVMGDNDMLSIHSPVPAIPLQQRPSICARVARERIVMVVNDVHTHPDFMPHPLLPETQSELCLPMIVGNQLIGILDVQARETGRFTEEDVRIHKTLAAQFAIAIQNARAFRLLARRAEELTILNEMSRSLSSTQGIQALLTTFVRYAARLLDTTNLYIAFYEPENQEAGEIVIVLDVADGQFKWYDRRRHFGNGLVEYIVRTERPLLIPAHVPEKVKELNLEIPGGVRSKSWLGAPMMVNGRVTGVVSLQNHTTPYRFNEDTQRLLVSMVNQVALAVENARLYAALQEQAVHLEQEVARRTAELTEANRQLTTEINEREQVQKSLQVYAQELERSNHELETFAYIASHDLQEPLRKITAFGSRLEEKYKDTLDERGLDYLQRMQSAATRMQELILDLLAFSRVTTQRQPFSLVSLNDILQHVLSDLEVRIEQTGATVMVSNLPEIEADATQIRQLLQNLVGNALKFYDPARPPILQISSQQINDAGREMCQILFEDNGIGIEAQHQERIFEIFERLHGRSTYEGSGVGLAICRKIVERHNGSILVESTPGEGTTFMVTLPCRQ